MEFNFYRKALLPLALVRKDIQNLKYYGKLRAAKCERVVRAMRYILVIASKVLNHCGSQN